MDEDTGNNLELEHADTQCGGQKNIKERKQAGASVTTRCTVSTARVKANSPPKKTFS